MCVRLNLRVLFSSIALMALRSQFCVCFFLRHLLAHIVAACSYAFVRFLPRFIVLPWRWVYVCTSCIVSIECTLLRILDVVLFAYFSSFHSCSPSSISPSSPHIILYACTTYTTKSLLCSCVLVQCWFDCVCRLLRIGVNIVCACTSRICSTHTFELLLHARFLRVNVYMGFIILRLKSFLLLANVVRLSLSLPFCVSVCMCLF